MTRFKPYFFFLIRVGNWMLSNRGLEHYVEFHNAKYRWHGWKQVHLIKPKSNTPPQ